MWYLECFKIMFQLCVDGDKLQLSQGRPQVYRECGGVVYLGWIFASGTYRMMFRERMTDWTLMLRFCLNTALYVTIRQEARVLEKLYALAS